MTEPPAVLAEDPGRRTRLATYYRPPGPSGSRPSAAGTGSRSLLVEGGLDPLAQLAADAPLLRRRRLDDEADATPLRAEVLDAPHSGSSSTPSSSRQSSSATRLITGARARGRCRRRPRRPAARATSAGSCCRRGGSRRWGRARACRRRRAGASSAATPPRRCPVCVVEVDDVADAELVLDQDEDARQEVAHQRLRAEADRHAEHAGAGEQRRRGRSRPRRGTSAAATSQITKSGTLRSTLESASMRCSARRLVSPVSSSAAGVSRRTAPIRSRRAGVQARERALDGAPRQALRTAAAIRIRTIFSGGPRSQSVGSVGWVLSSSIASKLANGMDRIRMLAAALALITSLCYGVPNYVGRRSRAGCPSTPCDRRQVVAFAVSRRCWRSRRRSCRAARSCSPRRPQGSGTRSG